MNEVAVVESASVQEQWDFVLKSGFEVIVINDQHSLQQKQSDGEFKTIGRYNNMQQVYDAVVRILDGEAKLEGLGVKKEEAFNRIYGCEAEFFSGFPAYVASSYVLPDGFTRNRHLNSNPLFKTGVMVSRERFEKLTQ